MEGAALDLKATLIAQGKQLEKKAEEEIKKVSFHAESESKIFNFQFDLIIS